MDKGTLNKTILIAPHPDDEVYGCASYLKNCDDSLLVVYVTSYHSLFPDGRNKHEQRQLSEWLGFQSEYMNTRAETNKLDKLGQLYFIKQFEALINKHRPELVLLPSPSYNQDHRVVYDAALTAMRAHDRIHFVKKILLYEEPDTWGTMRKPEPFNASYFRPLDMAFKHQLLSIYSSQMRGHRTPEQVEAIARVRGMQADMEYAEAFEVVRWIE